MKSSLKKLSGLLLAFIILTFSNVFSDENKWKIEIALEKETYTLYEPIWLDVTLTNNSDDTLRTHGLDAPTLYSFTVEMKDMQGKSLEYTGPAYLIGTSPGRLLLEPGEQDFGSFDLLRLFGFIDNRSGYTLPWLRFSYIPTGRYTVQAHFEKASSNKLTLNILRPFGDEKEVLELIEKAGNVWRKDNTEPSSRIYQEIVEKFPNSVLAERCFYLSKFYSKEIWDGYKQGTFDERILRTEMLDTYPNSGNTKGYILGITREMDDDQKLKLYTKLIKDYPDTRCARFAEQAKKRMMADKQ